MAIYVNVSLGGNNLRNGLRVPPLRFKLRLGTKGASTAGKRPWSVVGAAPNGFIGWAHAIKGTYKRGVAGWFEFYADGIQIMELRNNKGDNAGMAFAALHQQRREFELQGEWESAAPAIDAWKGSWGGLMLKGAASAGARVDAGVGALLNLADPAHGIAFGTGGAGVGLTIGASGGLAIVLATGFPTASKFSGFTSSGRDWDLSFGPKISAFIKGSSRLAQAGGILFKALDKLEALGQAKRLQKIMRSEEQGKEIFGLAKGVYQSYWIDDEAQSIIAVDIPLAGGGAQIGYHYAWSTTALLSQW